MDLEESSLPPGSSADSCKPGGRCSHSSGTASTHDTGVVPSPSDVGIKPKALGLLGSCSAAEPHPSLAVLFHRSMFHKSILKTQRSSSTLPAIIVLSLFPPVHRARSQMQRPHTLGKHSTAHLWPRHPNPKL